MAMDVLQLEGEIGSGAVAKVYRGKFKGEECAVKIIRSLTKEMRGTLVKEYKTLSRLSHMNVIEVKEFIQTEDSLVLELCGIKLADKTVVDVKEWAMNIAKKTTNETADAHIAF